MEINESEGPKLYEPRMSGSVDNLGQNEDRSSVEADSLNVNSSLAMFDDALKNAGKNVTPTVSGKEPQPIATTSKHNTKDSPEAKPKSLFHFSDNLKKDLSLLAYPSKSAPRKKGIISSRAITSGRITIAEALEKAKDARESITNMQVTSDKPNVSQSNASTSSSQMSLCSSIADQKDPECDEMVGHLYSDTSGDRGIEMTMDPSEANEIVADVNVINDASLGDNASNPEGKSMLLAGKNKPGGSARVELTRRMWELLKFTFNHEHFPSSVHMARLAKMMGRPWSQIRNWFTDRRVDNKKAGIFPRDRPLTECHYCNIKLDTEAEQKGHLFSSHHVKRILGTEYCGGASAESIKWKKLPKTVNAVSKVSGARILAVGFSSEEHKKAQNKKAEENKEMQTAVEKPPHSKELKKLWTNAMLHPEEKKQSAAEWNPGDKSLGTHREAYLQGEKDAPLHLKVTQKEKVSAVNHHENVYGGQMGGSNKFVHAPVDAEDRIPSRVSDKFLRINSNSSAGSKAVAGTSRDPDPVTPSVSTFIPQDTHVKRTYHTQDVSSMSRFELPKEVKQFAKKLKTAGMFESPTGFQSSTAVPFEVSQKGLKKFVPVNVNNSKTSTSLESELMALTERSSKDKSSKLTKSSSQYSEFKQNSESNESWQSNTSVYKDEGICGRKGELQLVNPKNTQSFTINHNNSPFSTLHQNKTNTLSHDASTVSKTSRVSIDKRKVKGRNQPPLGSVLRANKSGTSAYEGNIIVGYQCPTCNKVYQTEWLMMKHCVTHWKYHCDICYKVYPTENMMKVHLLDHLSGAYEDEKYYCQFSCKVCHSLKCGCYEPTYCKPRALPRLFVRPQKAKRSKKGFISKPNSGPNDHLKISLSTYRKLLLFESLGKTNKKIVDPQTTSKAPTQPVLEDSHKVLVINDEKKPASVGKAQISTSVLRETPPFGTVKEATFPKVLKVQNEKPEFITVEKETSPAIVPKERFTESIAGVSGVSRSNAGVSGVSRSNAGVSGVLDSTTGVSGSLPGVSGVSGSIAGVSGSVAGVSGSISGRSGSISGRSGSITGVSGSVAGVSGSVAGVSGSVAGTSGSVAGVSGRSGSTASVSGVQPQVHTAVNPSEKKFMTAKDKQWNLKQLNRKLSVDNKSDEVPPPGSSSVSMPEGGTAYAPGIKKGGYKRKNKANKQANNFAYDDSGFYYMCEMCDANFSSKSELSEHMFLHRLKFRSRRGEKRGLPFEIQDKNDGKKIKLHTASGTKTKDEEIPTCDKCECTFPTMADYHTHTLLAHKPTTSQKNEVFRCNYCDKNYRRIRELKRHLKRDCASVPRSVREQISSNEVSEIHYTTVKLDFEDKSDVATKSISKGGNRGPIVCKYCSAMTKREAEMKRHIWKFCLKVPSSVVRKFMDGTSLEDLGFKFLNSDASTEPLPKEEPQDMDTDILGTSSGVQDHVDEIQTVTSTEVKEESSPEKSTSQGLKTTMESELPESSQTSPDAQISTVQEDKCKDSNDTRKKILTIRQDLFEDSNATETSSETETCVANMATPSLEEETNVQPSQSEQGVSTVHAKETKKTKEQSESAEEQPKPTKSPPEETKMDSSLDGDGDEATPPAASTRPLANLLMQIPSVLPVTTTTSKAKRPLVCGYCGIWYFREMAILKHMKERCIKIPPFEKDLLKENNTLCNVSQKPGGDPDSDNGAMYKMVKVPEHMQNTPVPMPRDVSNEDIKELNANIKVYGETTPTETKPPKEEQTSPATVSPPVTETKPSPKRGSRCRRCHEHFSSQDAVLAHSSVHHGPKKGFYKCKLCHARMVKYKQLREHVWEHTNENPYRCHLCGVKYRSSDFLVDHLLTIHQYTSINEKNLYKWLPGRHGRYREIKVKPTNCEEKLDDVDTNLESLAEVMVITDQDICSKESENKTTELNEKLDDGEKEESESVQAESTDNENRTDKQHKHQTRSTKDCNNDKNSSEDRIAPETDSVAEGENIAENSGNSSVDTSMEEGNVDKESDTSEYVPRSEGDTDAFSGEGLLPLFENLDSVVETIQLTDNHLS